MNEMGKPEEAMELVKLGIRNDMRCEQLAAHEEAERVAAAVHLERRVAAVVHLVAACNLL